MKNINIKIVLLILAFLMFFVSYQLGIKNFLTANTSYYFGGRYYGNLVEGQNRDTYYSLSAFCMFFLVGIYLFLMGIHSKREELSSLAKILAIKDSRKRILYLCLYGLLIVSFFNFFLAQIIGLINLKS